MTVSTIHASAESPAGLGRYRSQRGLCGGSVRDPGAGLARIDRDWQLLEVLRRHDPAAPEQLVAVYSDRAYRLAISITGNAQDAEEAVQDAFWRVIRKIDTFRGDSAFRTWVCRIVRNAAYQTVRRRRQPFVEISLDEVLPRFHENGRHAGVIRDWSSIIDDPAVQAELRAALSSALTELPVHYRSVIVLHDVEGLSMREVAVSLGITVSAAKIHAHRARLFLRKRLSMFAARVGASVEREGFGSDAHDGCLEAGESDDAIVPIEGLAREARVRGAESAGRGRRATRRLHVKSAMSRQASGDTTGHAPACKEGGQDPGSSHTLGAPQSLVATSASQAVQGQIGRAPVLDP